jgi:SAM-dependent methyltransferase
VYVASRSEVLRRGLDLSKLTGVEIGALDSPIVKKWEGDVIYLDLVDTEGLRKKYPQFDPATIVEVDALWGEQTLADSLGGRKFDYVIASHVAEHVPDLVTWLSEIHAVLKPSGQLRLVIPDKRFSFDALRDETGISDLLTAYLLRARRPQVREVLDHYLHHAPEMNGWGVYEGVFDLSTLKPKFTHEHAMRVARSVMKPEVYHDVHCWVYTPRTFAAHMEKLAEFGLLHMACADFIDSSHPVLEFYVFMQPCDDLGQVAESWRNARNKLRSSPVGSAAEAAALAAATEACRTAEELESARQRIRLLENSRSWKVTAPLRRLKAMILHGGQDLEQRRRA